MKVGRRKLLAIGVAGVIAIVAVTAWLLLGTDALIGVLLAVSIGGSLVLGWLLAQTERKMTQAERRMLRMESSLQREIIASREISRRDAIESRKTWDRLASQIDDDITSRLDEFVGLLALDTREQTENLLKVISSSAKRTDVASSLDRLSDAIGTETERVIEVVKTQARP